MKITIATGLYPPEIGGPATYAAMLEAELPARGFTIATVPFGLVRHYPKVIRHIIYTWKLWRESRHTDLVYALDPISVGLPALLVSRLRRRPFLLRVPGDYAWEQGQARFGVSDRLHDFIEKRYSYGWQVSVLCWLESFVASRAKRVVVPSEYMCEVMGKWGVDKKNVSVIYSALFSLPVSGTRESLRDQLGYSYPTIVSAGRLVPNKGFLTLMDAFQKLLRLYPGAQLVIVGDGPQHDDLLRHADGFGTNNRVRLLGQLSKEALGAVVKAADVFVLNTAHEGLSHQLIEVMDLGVPIVTTNVGGNPELIEHGTDGFLVEFNNQEEIVEAIVRILDQPGTAERLVQSARARSKKFAKEAVIKEIETLLRSLQ